MDDRLEGLALLLESRVIDLFGRGLALRELWLDAAEDPLRAIALVRGLYPNEIGLAEAKAFIETAPVYLGSWTRASLPIPFAGALLRSGCDLSVRPRGHEPAHALHLALPNPEDAHIRAVIGEMFPNQNLPLYGIGSSEFTGFIVTRYPPTAARLAYLKMFGVHVELRDV